MWQRAMGPHSNSALDRRSGEPLWGDNSELNLRLGRSQPWGELGASEQGGLGLDQCGWALVGRRRSRHDLGGQAHLALEATVKKLDLTLHVMVNYSLKAFKQGSEMVRLYFKRLFWFLGRMWSKGEIVQLGGSCSSSDGRWQWFGSGGWREWTDLGYVSWGWNQ